MMWCLCSQSVLKSEASSDRGVNDNILINYSYLHDLEVAAARISGVHDGDSIRGDSR